jgi:hypothetical protein
MEHTTKALAAALIAVFAAAGCSNPCNDLKAKCSDCSSSLAKAACETLVKGDNGDACKAAIDNKQYEKDSVACTTEVPGG